MKQEKEWPPSHDEIEPWTHRHSQRRFIWLYDADRLITEANELADVTVSHPFNEKQAKQVRRAARLFLKSAQFYKQAGLGLQAVTSYEDAANCYARLGDDEQCEKCEEFADAIETFLDEEDE